MSSELGTRHVAEQMFHLDAGARALPGTAEGRQHRSQHLIPRPVRAALRQRTADQLRNSDQRPMPLAAESPAQDERPPGPATAAGCPPALDLGWLPPAPRGSRRLPHRTTTEPVRRRRRRSPRSAPVPASTAAAQHPPRRSAGVIPGVRPRTEAVATIPRAQRGRRNPSRLATAATVSPGDAVGAASTPLLTAEVLPRAHGCASCTPKRSQKDANMPLAQLLARLLLFRPHPKPGGTPWLNFPDSPAATLTSGTGSCKQPRQGPQHLLPPGG